MSFCFTVCLSGNTPSPCIGACQQKSCHGYPEATCIPDPCNNCSVKFVDSNMNTVKCDTCKCDFNRKFSRSSTFRNISFYEFCSNLRGRCDCYRIVVWIYNYLCNQCLSPLTLWVRTPLRWGVIDTTLCVKVCQWLAGGLWFSLVIMVSSTNKTYCHDITAGMKTKIMNLVASWAPEI